MRRNSLCLSGIVLSFFIASVVIGYFFWHGRQRAKSEVEQFLHRRRMGHFRRPKRFAREGQFLPDMVKSQINYWEDLTRVPVIPQLDYFMKLRQA